MLKTWKSATMKQQFYAAICFIIAYFSPLIGIFILLFMKIRHIEVLFRKAIILGMVSAMLLYTIDTIIYII